MYEIPTARAVHGTSCVVWGRPEYIKVGVSESQLLLLSRTTTRVSVLLFPVRSSCCFSSISVSAVLLPVYVVADVFSFGHSCIVSSM